MKSKIWSIYKWTFLIHQGISNLAHYILTIFSWNNLVSTSLNTARISKSLLKDLPLKFKCQNSSEFIIGNQGDFYSPQFWWIMPRHVFTRAQRRRLNAGKGFPPFRHLRFRQESFRQGCFNTERFRHVQYLVLRTFRQIEVRECVSTGVAGARTRRSLGHHLLHPLILRLLVLCAAADFKAQSSLL